MNWQAWGTGRRPFAFTIWKVVSVNVFHRENEILLETKRGIRRDDVRMPQFGDGPDLAEETIQDAGLFHDLTRHHLQHLVASHQLVMGEIDDAHAAAAEFLQAS